MVILLVFATLFSCASAVTSWGRCQPQTYLIDGIDVNQYIGTWYENSRTADIPFESGNCVQAEYTLNADGSVKVDNSQVINGERSHALGRAVPDKTNANTLWVSFSTGIIGRLTQGNYQVIDTDYESFSLVYSCTNALFWKIEYSWILSRTPQLDQSKLNSLVSLTKNRYLGFSDSDFYFTKQDAATCGN